MGLLESLACRQLHCIESTSVWKEIITEMRQYSISSILVEQDQQLIGIITERDLVRVAAIGLQEQQELTAGDIMTPGVISLPYFTLLDEALLTMERHRIRHLMVTDSTAQPRGIVTHTDIVRKLEEDFFKAPRPVKEYMSTELAFVGIDASFGDAIKTMARKQISCIVVVDQQKPLGILTERDVVKWLQQDIPHDRSIEGLMSVPVYHVKPSISIYDAAKIMEGYQIRHLIVWDGSSERIGLLTNTDVVRSIRDNYRGYLEREAMRTRKILDLIHEGVAEVNCENEYRVEWINHTGATMFGYDDVYQAIGSSFIEWINGAERQIVLEDFAKGASRDNLQCDIYAAHRKRVLLLSYHLLRDELISRTMYRVLFRDITVVMENRQHMENRIRKQKRQFQALFDNTTDAVVIFGRDKRVQMVNQRFLLMFEYETNQDILDRDMDEIINEREFLNELIDDYIFKGNVVNVESFCTTNTGNRIYVLLKGGPVVVDGEVTGGYMMYADITERKMIMHELQASEEKYRTLIQTMGEGMALLELVYDDEGRAVDYRFLEVNPAFELHTGVPAFRVCGRTGKEILQMERPLFLKEFMETVVTEQPRKMEVYLEILERHFRISIFTPKRGLFAILFANITGERKKEEQIRYLAYHDVLTGIYNRAFFEREIKKLDKPAHLPVAIVMADLNRLKLVNDAFGHEQGDQLIKLAADVIKASCGEQGFAARLGGDEFVMVWPNVSLDIATECIEQMKRKMSLLHVNGIKVSVSFGVAVKDVDNMNIYDVIRQSEAEMYNRKLFESHHTKNELVAALLKILEKKTTETKRHCQNILQLGWRLCKFAEVSEEEMEKFKLLALLHDIGKITIPEKILKKPDALTMEEWEIIKKHPESGYRIVNSIPEFAFVAEYILCHHERMDGSGYPRNLKGDEIPRVARILAVVDAYESMTRHTVYRKALDAEQAKEELRNNAGTQFDPEYVKIFLEKVL